MASRYTAAVFGPVATDPRKVRRNRRAKLAKRQLQTMKSGGRK